MDRVGVTGFGWEMEIKIPAFAGMTGMGRGGFGCGGAEVGYRPCSMHHRRPCSTHSAVSSVPNAVNCIDYG